MCHYKLEPFKNGKRFKIFSNQNAYKHFWLCSNWMHTSAYNRKSRKTFDLMDIARNYVNDFQFVLVWRSLKKR